MKEKVLIAGASGVLGLEISKILSQEQVSIRAVVHSSGGADKVSPYTSDIWKADASKGIKEVEGITENITTVISALGKSVSLFTSQEKSFMEIDFFANNNILDDAKRNGVKRFLYVSIKGADTGQDYNLAKAHKRMEDAIRASGISHTIIRPVGFFSGLNDLAIMAKRQVIPVVGTGEARTNSIYQKDLAEFVVGHLEEGPEMVEVGGPLIHTRLEMAEMIRTRFGGKIINLPEKLVNLGMLVPNMFSDDISSKLSYFKYVTANDMIGEKTGSITFEQYLNDLDINDLP